MAFLGINFRATSGYVTNGTDETHSLGETYPTTRGGLTFGFSSSAAANARDRNSGIDRRLAGMVGQPNASGTNDFRLDLPGGAGTYRIKLALGDAEFGQNHRCLILDGTGGSTLATINNATLTGQWVDAGNTVRFSASGWVTDNATIELTFTANHLVLRLGSHSSGSSSTTISHLAIEQVGGGPPPGSKLPIKLQLLTGG